MKRLKLLLVVTLAAIPLVPIQAGHNKCNPEQGAPCKMDTCAAHGKQTPPYCSPKCHKDCCFCAKSCNGHNPERTPQPEEEQ